MDKVNNVHLFERKDSERGDSKRYGPIFAGSNEDGASERPFDGCGSDRGILGGFDQLLGHQNVRDAVHHDEGFTREWWLSLRGGR